MSARYAIYFAPAKHSPWWEFGARWLGRDEHDDSILTSAAFVHWEAAELASLTREPRRYGFHATLKAPFQLSSGQDEIALITRLRSLAATMGPLRLGPLCLNHLGGFVALVPSQPSTALQELAMACVTQLDDLRAPMQPVELQRRRAEVLDARGQELLALYGYPHVMERFRLHMTLTGTVEPVQALRVMQLLEPQVLALNRQAPLSLDRLCLFVERSPGAPFRRVIDLKLQP